MKSFNYASPFAKSRLRRRDPLPLPDGVEVDVTMTLREAGGKQLPAIDDRSWDVLTQLLTDCAIDTGISDSARRYDRYLYCTRASSED
jgi:hypothetical protein